MSIIPGVVPDDTLTQIQLFQVLEVLYSQLRVREEKRRYYAEKRPSYWMDVTAWPATLRRDIFGERAILNRDRYQVPVPIGPPGDPYHNIRGFEYTLKNIQRTLEYLGHPWRVYTRRRGLRYTEREVLSRRGDTRRFSEPAFGEMPLGPANLEFVAMFSRLDQAREFVAEQKLRPSYIFHFEEPVS